MHIAEDTIKRSPSNFDLADSSSVLVIIKAPMNEKIRASTLITRQYRSALNRITDSNNAHGAMRVESTSFELRVV
jgi:hypothetical protein